VQLGQLKNDGSDNIQESEQDDDSTLSEPIGTSSACIPDSSLDFNTWVKAAEFVPGQLWQSVGK